MLLKGVFSGAGSVIIGLCLGERVTEVWSVFAVLSVGFVAYGLSIFLYVYAQRLLGAARTSAYYAVAPFIGAFLSLLIFRQLPDYMFFIALAVMAAGAWLCSQDKPIFAGRKSKRPVQESISAEENEKNSIPSENFCENRDAENVESRKETENLLNKEEDSKNEEAEANGKTTNKGK